MSDTRGAAQRIEELKADQCRRWQAGERVPTEAYRNRHPELAADALGLLELVYNEILLREGAGEGPELAAYLERFPDLAEHLPPLFEVHRGFPSTFTVEGEGGTVRPPRVVGYELLGELGRGGMGVVYKARHIELDRVVALKMIQAGAFAAPVERIRFRDEARKLARLSHPNVVPIYEVGEQDGLPFFAMEFVAGGTLAARLDGTPLPAPRAAALIEPLASAVQFVHQAGIVHRDLKPANVLLASGGCEPPDGSRSPRPSRPFGDPHPPLAEIVPKIADFGLARFLDGDRGLTRTGAIGTPSYMAPEQAAGRSREAGPAADIYSLGAILYELLTGRPPFRAATALETLEQVRSDEPPRPRYLQLKTPRDLETICLKCLRKEPARRYASALDLADDLRRFLDGRPIQARPAGPLERAAKWARRRPAAAAAVAVGLASALLLAGGLTVYVADIRALNGDLRTARDKEIEERRRAAVVEEKARHDGYAPTFGLALQLWNTGNVRRAQDILTGLMPPAGKSDLRGFEWRYLQRQCYLERYTLPGHPPDERSTVVSDLDRRIAFSPAGPELAWAYKHCITVWDARTERRLQIFPAHEKIVSCLAFSPDGRSLASGGSDRALCLWEPRSGRRIWSREGGHLGGVSCVAFSPDGRSLASGSEDGIVKCWDATTGRERDRFPRKGRRAPVASVAFGPDGRWLAAAHKDGQIALWDATAGAAEPVLLGWKGDPALTSVAFDPDRGRWLASAGADGAVRLWDIPSRQVRYVFPGHRGGASCVCFHPCGDRLASAGADGIVRVWDWKTGREVLALRGHDDAAIAVAFSRDGTRLASVGRDKQVKLWDATPDGEIPAFPKSENGFNGVAFAPDGRHLAAIGGDGTVTVWDRPAGGVVRQFATRYFARAHCVAYSPNGRYLAASTGKKKLTVWDVSAGYRPLDLAGHAKNITSVAFSPDSTLLATASEDKTVTVWDPASGREQFRLEGHGNSVRGVGFSPDGRRLASAGEDQTVIVWDVVEGKPLLTLKGHKLGVTAVAFSPDGKYVATGGGDRAVRLWDVGSGGELVWISEGHTDQVSGLAFSPAAEGGSAARVVLVSAGKDGTVRLWEVQTGREMLRLSGPEPFNAVAFGPDGFALAAAGAGGVRGNGAMVWLWDATPLGAEFLARRRAVRLVRALYPKWQQKAEVLRVIAADETLSEAERQAASELVEVYARDWLAPLP